MNKHLPIALLVLAGLLVASPSRADDFDWHTIGWSTHPSTIDYPESDYLDPNYGTIYSTDCQSRCCYPSWLYESGYIWTSSTPPQPGDNESQGDWSYDGWCTQAFINEMWHPDNWGFDTDNWNGGFGASINPCDRRLPLARMLVSLYVFKNSWGPTTPNDELGLILKNAYPWAKGQTDEVDAACDRGDGVLETYAKYREDAGNEYTQFYWGFFYGQSVPERAMSIFHESRHADGCSHNAMDLGSSVDDSWNDGCEWSWWEDNDGMSELPSEAGARQYEAMWGWAFYKYGQNTTPALRARALAAVNDIFHYNYRHRPCFRVGTDGEAYLLPHILCDWMVPPQQNVSTYLMSQAHLPPANGPIGYVAYNSTIPPYVPPYYVNYDPAPWSSGAKFDWALRAVEIPGQQLARVGSYQIYTSTVGGTDYCLQPSQPTTWQLEHFWLDGSTSSGVECENLPFLTGLQAVPCTSPTDQNPQPRTWFQVTPLTTDFLGYVLSYTIAYIKPTLRCRTADSGEVHEFTLNDSLCLTTIGGFVGFYSCIDWQAQSFDIHGWIQL